MYHTRIYNSSRYKHILYIHESRYAMFVTAVYRKYGDDDDARIIRSRIWYRYTYLARCYTPGICQYLYGVIRINSVCRSITFHQTACHIVTVVTGIEIVTTSTADGFVCVTYTGTWYGIFVYSYQYARVRVYLFFDRKAFIFGGRGGGTCGGVS